MCSRRQRSIQWGGRYIQVSLYHTAPLDNSKTWTVYTIPQRTVVTTGYHSNPMSLCWYIFIAGSWHRCRNISRTQCLPETPRSLSNRFGASTVTTQWRLSSTDAQTTAVFSVVNISRTVIDRPGAARIYEISSDILNGIWQALIDVSKNKLECIDSHRKLNANQFNFVVNHVFAECLEPLGLIHWYIGTSVTEVRFHIWTRSALEG